MHYPEDFELPVPEAITLSELLFELEKEVSEVASTDGRYLSAWQNLTPASAIEFLMHRRYDIEERCRWSDDDILEAYVSVAPVFLRDMCRVATLVEAALNGKPFDDPVLPATPNQQHDSQLPGHISEQEAALCSTDIGASYDRLLSLALNVRTVKPEATAGMTTWTAETSKSIEEIRASDFADRTVYLLRDFLLPSPLQKVMSRRHLAIKVSDEWMSKYVMTHVTHDAPSLAVVHRPHEGSILVLELASGTIRLDATRMASHLREFDTEMPILFISSDLCALAVHRFNALVDGNIIEDFARRPESHELLPQRDTFARLPDGFAVVAEERFSVFDCWHTERPLTEDPDKLEDIPF
ncbi:hypothetical protein [Paraburkholderia azotifigens]|uniref:Uncharacterized protein n=1 Tax=Paraburkholderia azotifigens TaxID=2057004 RepID=A0A5C6V5X7_9BURK|nr:hypothetical protein [Paraburkholderia azotifigens]TXC79115.1 hypothetical protein FRZ40_32360 [Paraburkholderia azotifigens]